MPSPPPSPALEAILDVYDEWRTRNDNLLDFFHGIATCNDDGDFELDLYYTCAFTCVILIYAAYVFIAIELLLCETFPKQESICMFKPRPHRPNTDWVAYGRYPPWRHNTNWTVYWRYD